jgi:GT2 family glycosyltransferase
VVVLATGHVPEIGAALDSLLGQAEPLEIVVVHSAATRADLDYVLPSGVLRFSSPDLLLTGAARNQGVSMTRAPWVGFLSADCRALPGWSAGRLAAHRRGLRVVAAALVNPHPASSVAWASYITLHHRRWPTLDATTALHYGGSYERESLRAAGGFDARLAVGEDTDLHRRLASIGVRTHWEPAVQATHPYPTALGTFRREQFERGRRGALSWLEQGSEDLARELGRSPTARARRALTFAWTHAGSARVRLRVLQASAWVFEGSRCYARGAQATLGLG